MEKERNLTFSILSCIAISLIILGHLDYNILEFGGLFPYYSYHVMIFVFIAGYFYKPEDEKHILAFIKRKTIRLLLPYGICNLFIGLLLTVLHKFGFSYGGNVTLYNLFVAPFADGHQFMLNAPGWFIPALFLLELCNVIGRKILSFIKLDNEYVIFVLYLILGITTVILSQRGSVYDWYRLPGRLLLMAPILQLGRLYKAKLEEKDKLNNMAYFSIILILNLILCFSQGGLAFSAVWVSGFKNYAVIPYITTVTGIALWLRIAKIIASIPGKHSVADYVGRHTMEICLYHLSGWLVVGLAFMFLNRTFGICTDFDPGRFMSDVYYAYCPNGIETYKWIYIAASFGLPLGITYLGDRIGKTYLGDRIGKLICGLRKNGKTTK